MEVAPHTPAATPPPAPGGAGAPAPPPEGGPAAAPLKILFVDDEPDLAPLIRQTFRRRVREGHYALEFAGDGVEALEKLDADPGIEVVVTDLNMPRMDGLTLLAHLRERERPRQAIVVTAYGDMENIRRAMNQGAFDFLTKPIDLGDLETTIGNARVLVEREREAARVRQAFGRYLSDDVAQAVLSNPGQLGLGGERREVSVLMSDLAGFSAVAERLEPERVVELLNVYLAAMAETVEAYGGTVDEFIGDAVLAIFGAPLPRPDHAARAVACAVAMQRRMGEVNAELGQRGLPRLEMTAAVNTGEVVVGSIGSERRAKYGVVGSPVNLTSRIQTVAAPGEVVVSDATLRSAGDGVRVRETREVALKGFEQPIRVHFVEHVGGAYALDLPDGAGDPLVPLAQPLPVEFFVLDGKMTAGEPMRGSVAALSGTRALLHATQPVEPRADLKLSVAGASATGDVYAKVLAAGTTAAGAPALTLRLTSVPEELAAAFRALRGGEAIG